MNRKIEKLTREFTKNFFDLPVAFVALKVHLQHHCGDLLVKIENSLHFN